MSDRLLVQAPGPEPLQVGVPVRPQLGLLDEAEAASGRRPAFFQLSGTSRLVGCGTDRQRRRQNCAGAGAADRSSNGARRRAERAGSSRRRTSTGRVGAALTSHAATPTVRSRPGIRENSTELPMGSAHRPMPIAVEHDVVLHRQLGRDAWKRLMQPAASLPCCATGSRGQWRRPPDCPPISRKVPSTGRSCDRPRPRAWAEPSRRR